MLIIQRIMSMVNKVSAMVFQNNQRIHRRHGFGEIIEKYIVGDRVSAKIQIVATVKK